MLTLDCEVYEVAGGCDLDPESVLRCAMGRLYPAFGQQNCLQQQSVPIAFFCHRFLLAFEQQQ